MRKSDWYRIFLFVLFFSFWVWAAINPKYPYDWWLENLLVFVFVPLIVLTRFYFRLSNFAYTLITIFMIMHVIGSHYTFAEVPFGYVLKEWLNAGRNMYDRLVHFCFGFLLAYPIREVYCKLTGSKGFWGYWLPVELAFSISALYELIEWGVVKVAAPEAGIAFLGIQDDVWDAHKDMFLGGAGAFMAMAVLFIVHFYTKEDFWKDITNSFKIKKNVEVTQK